MQSCRIRVTSNISYHSSGGLTFSGLPKIISCETYNGTGRGTAIYNEQTHTYDIDYTDYLKSISIGSDTVTVSIYNASWTSAQPWAVAAFYDDDTGYIPLDI